MSKDRIIRVLTDDEVSALLTGLRILSGKYVSEGDDVNVKFVNNLYDDIDNSSDVGVISYERI